MNRNRNVFLIGLVCLVIFVIILTTILKQFIPLYITPYWALQIVLFVSVSVIVFFSVTKARSKQDIYKFTNFYMGITIAKIILYFAIILLYALLVSTNVKAFIITFFIYYICFSTFETYFLVRKNK